MFYGDNTMADKKLTDKESKGIIQGGKESLPLNLGDSQYLDISKLTVDQQQAVSLKLQEAKIDLAKKAEEAKIDLQITKVQVDNLMDSSNDANKTGTSFTATHSQDTSIGRTEVVVGNTERAAAGKMSRSGAGQDDISMKAIICVGIVIILLAILLGN
jgi:maltoporin